MIKLHAGRRSVLGVLAGFAAVGLIGCGSTDRMRYRLTVEVETPKGLRTGSVVREITHSVPSAYPSIGESKPQWRVKGQSVAVDLPGNQTLFALLRSEGDGDFGGWGVWWLFRQQRPARSIVLWPGPVKQGAPIVNDPYPILVRFRDIADPTTVERVDPDDFAKSFGPGVKLRRITVQLTDNPVTVGIEKRFSWWKDHRDRHFDGTSTMSEDMTSNKLVSHMSSGDFSTEFNK